VAPRSENPKQIQKRKIGKAQHIEREVVLGIAPSQDFEFRASDLDHSVFTEVATRN
jgi:hypothetical protein